MKINPSVGFEHYQSYMQSVKNTDLPAAKQQPELQKTPAVAGPNTDTVQISEDAALRAETERMAKSMANEVENSATQDRIDQLRASVQAGTYNVSSQEIAQAIISKLV